MALVLTMFVGSAVFAAAPNTPGQNTNMSSGNGNMGKSSGRRRRHGRRRHRRGRKSMSKTATNANTR
jgi:hypothetical protein